MSAPDIRAFYASLGIELPGWADRNATVRCFAQPGAHRRGDRSPSCSVSLISGAWNCHGCGASGGAYDAALASGHTPRSAIDLMIAHGLAEPRIRGRASRTRDQRSPRRRPAVQPVDRVALAADENDVRRWAAALATDMRLTRRLLCDRAWSPRITAELQLGYDGTRVTLPIRDRIGKLRGILRTDPFGIMYPKTVAVPGTRLGLIPSPKQEQSRRILLVEGVADMIAARSCGLPAIAVPGTSAWRPSWAGLLEGRWVTIVMDCDTPGRRAAARIRESLEAVAESLSIVDLWPDREDGYDLSDRILERRRMRPHAVAARTVGALLLEQPSRRIGAA